MAEKKKLSEKEIGKRIVDLKIEVLKNPTKRGSIKREIARLLTMKKQIGEKDALTKSEEGEK